MLNRISFQLFFPRSPGKEIRLSITLPASTAKLSRERHRRSTHFFGAGSEGACLPNPTESERASESAARDRCRRVTWRASSRAPWVVTLRVARKGAPREASSRPLSREHCDSRAKPTTTTSTAAAFSTGGCPPVCPLGGTSSSLSGCSDLACPSPPRSGTRRDLASSRLRGEPGARDRDWRPRLAPWIPRRPLRAPRWTG